MSIWKYKRVTPTVIVEKLTLIKPEDLVDLASKNLDHFYSALMNTPYQTEVLALPAENLNSISLEDALLKNFIKTCEKIMEHSPKDIRLLIQGYLKKFEVENIKTMVRSKVSGVNVDEAMGYMTPVGRLDSLRCRRVLEKTKSVREVIEQLLDLEYGFILLESLKEYEKTGDMLLLEVALYEYVYSDLWRTAEKLRGLDKKIAKVVLGVEVASMNIKAILRGKLMGLREDQIRRYLILISELFDEKVLDEAINETDIEASITKLMKKSKLYMTRDYQYMLNDARREYNTSRSLSRLERTLDESLLETCLRMLKRYTPFFNVGLILAFINLKWFEVRNLRAILKGIEEKLPSDKIKELLILPSQMRAERSLSTTI